MNPRLDTLPPPQRRLWPELRATPSRFVLYGGTAIAFGILVASLRDLGGTKAQVVQSRALSKDYIDIDALMRRGGVPLTSMLGAAAAIHGEHYNAMLTLKALTYFGDGDLAELPAAVRKRLSQAAAKVDSRSIPRYEPQSGLVSSGTRP